MTIEGNGGRLGSVLARSMGPEARSGLVAREIGGIPVLEARLPGPFRALFTSRAGGTSAGGFASLNLDLRSADDAAAVIRNRDRVAAILDRRLVSPAQAHGIRVVGTAEYAREKPGSPCDGLTVHPELDRGLAALLLFADCVPVVLCGEVDMAVVHGGWRGILGGIVPQAGRAMIGPPGAAVIGPSIGPCCFTVSDDIAAAFAGRFGGEVVVSPSAEGEQPRVDLWAATAKALTESGVPPSHVVNPRLCTACNPDLFYSYRREGPLTGRQGCVAWVAGP